MRGWIRNLSGVAVVLALIMGLGACGDDDNGGGSAAGSAPKGVDLVSSGRLTVCSDTPYEPFEFAKDGKQVGYDMDILRDIASASDLTLTVKDLPFDGILGSLAAGDCDVVGSALTITDERAKQVDFSDPYFDADQSLLIRKADEARYKTLDDLAGRTIGVQSGTTGAAYAEAHKPTGATVKSFEDADGLFGAITSGDIDAVLQDFPVNFTRAQQDDKFVVTQSFPTGEHYGFAVKKGNAAMLGFINDGLKKLKDDGEIDKIYEKYFGQKPPSD